MLFTIDKIVDVENLDMEKMNSYMRGHDLHHVSSYAKSQKSFCDGSLYSPSDIKKQLKNHGPVALYIAIEDDEILVTVDPEAIARIPNHLDDYVADVCRILEDFVDDKANYVI